MEDKVFRILHLSQSLTNESTTTLFITVALVYTFYRIRTFSCFKYFGKEFVKIITTNIILRKENHLVESI